MKSNHSAKRTQSSSRLVTRQQQLAAQDDPNYAAVVKYHGRKYGEILLRHLALYGSDGLAPDGSGETISAQIEAAASRRR